MRDRRAEPGTAFWIALACGLVAVLVATYHLGTTYVARLAHPPGFLLVPVTDEVKPATSTPAFVRPRHAAFVVVDGLGAAAARGMRTVEHLSRAGQCLTTDVGPVTLSRPVYAVMSTGVEPDRTGIRLNPHDAPAAPESIWEVARRAGLRVSGTSDILWWKELFPRGFDEFFVVPEEVSYFPPRRLDDLSLFHPDYVDEAGHRYGAASPEYAAAVARVDGELALLLGALDLAQDLVVLTADHGHAPWGGHGGRTADIEHVVTCFAGLGVRHDERPGPMLSQSIGPAVTALLGLPFPRHMRAGDDDLDVVLRIVDAAAMPPAYVADRRAALARFRRENEAQLRAWNVDRASWSALYESIDAERRRRAAGALVVLLALATLVTARRGREGVVGAVWALAVMAVSVLAWLGTRHTFDFTSTNSAEEFIRAAVVVSAIAVLLAAILHVAIFRSTSRWALDQAFLASLVFGVHVAHVATFGSPIGPPLPGPILFFLPYPVSVFGAASGGLALVAALVSLARARRMRREPGTRVA